MQGSCFARIY